MYQQQEVLFPELRLFGSLFEKAYSWHPNRKQVWTVNGKTFSSYCHVDGLDEFQVHNVIPRPEVMAKLADKMIRVEDDEIYWKIVVRDNGSCGVYASYNKILGSRHVAEIQVWSVPVADA